MGTALATAYHIALCRVQRAGRDDIDEAHVRTSSAGISLCDSDRRFFRVEIIRVEKLQEQATLLSLSKGDGEDDEEKEGRACDKDISYRVRRGSVRSRDALVRDAHDASECVARFVASSSTARIFARRPRTMARLYFVHCGKRVTACDA